MVTDINEIKKQIAEKNQLIGKSQKAGLKRTETYKLTTELDRLLYLYYKALKSTCSQDCNM